MEKKIDAKRPPRKQCEPNAIFYPPTPLPKAEAVDYVQEPKGDGILDGHVTIPAGMYCMRVVGSCLEPVVRDGQFVMVVPYKGGDIPLMTPICVKLADGMEYCKLWGGIQTGVRSRPEAPNQKYVVMRYLNGASARPEMKAKVEDVVDFGIIIGVLFNGIPVNEDANCRGWHSIPSFNSIEQMIKHEEHQKLVAGRTLSLPLDLTQIAGQGFVVNDEAVNTRQRKAGATKASVKRSA